MGNTSTIQIEIQVDGKGGIKVLRQIGAESEKAGKKGQKGFRVMDRSVGDFNRRIQSSQKLLLQWGSTLLGGYVIKNVAGHFLDVASSFEQMEVKLDALTKGRGAETLEEINRWALDMPVNTRKAVDTFAMMQAMGLDPTIAKMQTLVDVASIFSEDAMPRVARALGQMQTLGKLSAEELNQMAEAGINARKYLTQAFGMTVTELQKSKISIDQIVNAIWRGLDADFAGAAKKAQSSWKGLWTTFISYTEEAERKIMAAGIFDELKTQMGGVNEELALWIENNNELIKQKVPEYIGTVKTAASGLYTTLSGLYGLYEKIPGEIVGAAGYGVAGRIIFGGWGPAKVVGGIYLINEGLKQFNLDIGTSIRLWKEYETAINNIMDVISGRRDWDTGELKHKIQEGPATYYGKIGPETPGYDIYKPPPTPEPKPPPPPDQQALKDYKALMTEVEKAQAEFQNALIIPSGTYETMEQQLRRGIGADITIRDSEKVREAYASMYSDLKFQSDEYYPYQLEQLQRQAEDYEAYTGDAVLAHQWLCEQIKELDKERLEAARKNNQYYFEMTERTMDAIEDNFSSFYRDFFRGELDSAEDYFRAFCHSLTDSFSDMLGQMTREFIFGGGSSGSSGIFSSLLSWGTGLFGGGTSLDASAGLGADWAGTLWHKGGIVGKDKAPTRTVPSALFTHAPRLHQGLAGDEFPAILQKGETVIPKGQPVQNLTISVPVTIEGQADERLASILSQEIEETARRVMREEMR